MIDFARKKDRKATLGHHMNPAEIKGNTEIVLVENHVILPHETITRIRKKVLAVKNLNEWHSRKYDETGTAFYHGENPPLIRQEPVMIHELNGDVEGTRVILRKMLDSNKDHLTQFSKLDTYLKKFAVIKGRRGVETSFYNDREGRWSMLRKMFTFIEKTEDKPLH